MPEVGLPSDALKIGRRAFEEFPGEVELLRDFNWEDSSSLWSFHIRLSPKIVPTSFVPAKTDWFVLVSPEYPKGRIDFFPARENGLTVTFQHQSYNASEGDTLWRKGKICLDTPWKQLGRYGGDSEPSLAEERLRWHIHRALGWLELAARDELASPNDPFELPDFYIRPDIGDEIKDKKRIAFIEDHQGLQKRTEVNAAQLGIAEIEGLPGNSRYIFVKEFHEARKISSFPEGGKEKKKKPAPKLAVWLYSDFLPAFKPYQAAMTWGELERVFQENGHNLYSTLSDFVRCADRPGIVTGLLGFPIPEKWGGPNRQIHWQAFELPDICSKAKQPKRRIKEKNESRKMELITRRIFLSDEKIKWIRSENWTINQITSRGQLNKSFAGSKCLLIGAGAVGSIISELLVRLGVFDITIYDSDTLEVGNLVRHSLSLKDVGKYKAIALADHLNRISPHTKALGIFGEFPPVNGKEVEKIQDCNLVIDCTAENDVLDAVGIFPWSASAMVASISITAGAKHLIFWYGPVIPATLSEFRAASLKHSDLLNEPSDNQECTSQPAGCYHPHFVARLENITLFAGAAVKQIEYLMENPPASPVLYVFTIKEESGFSALERI